jgi:alpha-tubulin suppressor-like RCC1 family protein
MYVKEWLITDIIGEKEEIRDIATGEDHSLLLTSSGKVYSRGCESNTVLFMLTM